MDRLYSPTAVKLMQNRHGVQASKSLGQNFLVDGNIVDKIVEGAEIREGDLVLEIGPGMGVITAAAAEQAARVVAVEIDKRLIPVLEETLAEFDNVKVIQGDVLKTDLEAVINEAREEYGKPFTGVRIMGNLPYYITTPIIMGILEKFGPTLGRSEEGLQCVFMVQKEVAVRMAAGPGGKDYGALSVAVSYYSEPELVTDVSREVFLPRPAVDSAVIRLRVRKEKPVEVKDEKLFFAVVKAGFGQRRKTLLNSLTGLLGFEKSKVSEILESAGIDGIRRAETLSLEEFARIADGFYDAK
ncbi:MAG: 16S rRNA (adenine(1518)-N(6)/adenine(1519)-N(6))-dimethyltransferase RsmA [Firmicutes bacterium]|nr:16S rRNA (adenine(1518)-N(6)/adenine(1519)-N(6))-dimethyltransferase RsmA [Clostridiales bacterium]MBQ9930826.1 16S rRNA (adenine(1518)-N(6)/adenine(1519)-N(6))-dimethyltransferase RsmA [Bacillota bacterium]